MDDGYEEGMEVPLFYDPMLAKLVVHASDRKAAIEKMLQAISDYQIHGVETTLNLCRFVLQHPEFMDGRFTTQFIPRNFKPELLRKNMPEDIMELAALLAASQIHRVEHELNQYQPQPPLNPWKLNRS